MSTPVPVSIGEVPIAAPDSLSPSVGLTRRVSRGQANLSEGLANAEHDLVFCVDCKSVTQIDSKGRTEISTGEDLEVGSYDITNLSTVQKELLTRGHPVSEIKFHILRCGVYVCLLWARTIAIRVEPLKYLITEGPSFVEVRLDDDCDEEETELLEDLLKNHTKFRVKGNVPKGLTPVVIGSDGKPLEAGIGDTVGAEIRSACHFLSKRLRETRPDMNVAIKQVGKTVRKFFKKCPPGSEIRVNQATIDNLRRAGLVVLNAKKSIEDNKGMLRGVSSQSGKAVGEAVINSKIGQRMLKNRTAKEGRRVLLATLDGADEVCAAAKGLPDQLMKAVQEAVEDVLGHVFGDRVQEAGRLSFEMLTAFLSIKYCVEWAHPARLAFTGQKSAVRVLVDNPSQKAVQVLEERKERVAKEEKLRDRILAAATTGA
eukprot:TRINITY_DN3258_c0_g2_i1.p1 TRINITY_DN3258_c0_g2~~TRINITY_DN3258_c0_g2_i1.p1  ORF type:complete len:455 (+),score=174.38 TRINITY_DN3258_c0_g2_i1:83-1366(+)